MSENKTEADTPTERYFTVVYKLTNANVAKYLSNRDWVTYIYTDSMAELASLKELTTQTPNQPGGFNSGDMASAAAQGYRDGWTAAQADSAEPAATQPAPHADSVRDYPPLPDLDSDDEPIWNAIFNWKTATPGSEALRKANAVESVISNQLRAYVDADRAARAPADGVTAPAYSIDADTQGIRARVAEAISGALAFGAQGANPPPTGHWLVPFWEAAREEASHNRPVSSDTLYLLRRLLSNQHTLTGTEFREELTKIVEAAFAARAPADSVTAPAGGETYHLGACIVDGVLSATVMRKERGCSGAATVLFSEQIPVEHLQDRDVIFHASSPAQAADSVREDADRYRWLADYLVGDLTDLDDEIVACKSVYDLSKVVDAARKQGGA